eukprot:scaffold19090_cov36-Phaeocystis_antarctica.AAC.1
MENKVGVTGLVFRTRLPIGRGWPRLEAALILIWRWRGVLEGELPLGGCFHMDLEAVVVGVHLVTHVAVHAHHALHVERGRRVQAASARRVQVALSEEPVNRHKHQSPRDGAGRLRSRAPVRTVGRLRERVPVPVRRCRRPEVEPSCRHEENNASGAHREHTGECFDGAATRYQHTPIGSVNKKLTRAGLAMAPKAWGMDTHIPWTGPCAQTPPKMRNRTWARAQTLGRISKRAGTRRFGYGYIDTGSRQRAKSGGV